MQPTLIENRGVQPSTGKKGTIYLQLLQLCHLPKLDQAWSLSARIQTKLLLAQSGTRKVKSFSDIP